MDVGLSDVGPHALARGDEREVMLVGELLCWLGQESRILPLVSKGGAVARPTTCVVDEEENDGNDGGNEGGRRWGRFWRRSRQHTLITYLSSPGPNSNPFYPVLPDRLRTQLSPDPWSTLATTKPKPL